MDRTALAKIEMQIRSVFDYELAMIARVLGVSADELLPTQAKLDVALPALMRGSVPIRKKSFPS